jgi:hypothetical protein
MNIFHSLVMCGKTKNKMTTVLGINLILLHVGVFLLMLKALYFGGEYDTWAWQWRCKEDYESYF